ncbi:CE1759 family FMN reductase [Glutamicibacter protophormiae]|uniref:CE1759 family FMN reductase n=1 Tax=Glutamicibacter protophormiae TaxID=37930 RepID=UPI002A7EC096|nr:CE1759 family FMN reductase [Glutamicibacter protophormiae]WPR65382.1 CE1759 family FMN reductase [Glutamicibacter protophormiae]WPR68880.1 CE1759 family FMN reductase [Glutamicibacter protophormiae]
MSKSVVVISGGLGSPSSSLLLGRQLGESIAGQLALAGVQADLTTVELREHASDITNNMLSGFAAPSLQRVIDAVVGADVLVAVTPVFTASVSGLFKSFLDILDPKSLSGKPVVLAATAGTQRHQLAIDYAMRPIFSYLRAQIMPTTVFAASEDFGGHGISGTLSDRAQRVAREVAAALAAAEGELGPDTGLGDTRSIAPSVSETADPNDEMASLPFEALLANVRAGAN